jgi:hypothetical protein
LRAAPEKTTQHTAKRAVGSGAKRSPEKRYGATRKARRSDSAQAGHAARETTMAKSGTRPRAIQNANREGGGPRKVKVS